MKRIVLFISIGCLLGYSMGFRDAQQHDRPVYERMLDNVGGAARGKYGGDVDGRGASVER
jgi:hypothetical protein